MQVADQLISPEIAGKARTATRELTRREVIAVPLLLALSCIGGCRQSAPPTLALATTTSVGNSGLLDRLVEAYRSQTGVTVRTQLVGSGLALRMLEARHVDAVVSHAPTAEAKALTAHPEWHYRKVMWNTFVIVGPATDPAGVLGAPDAVEAMRRIARSGAAFLSRGDMSGTHEREELLWTRAGERPAPDRLVVAGSGMGTTLRTASRTGAYTLTDTATFAQLKSNLELRVVLEGDAELLNTYAVIHDSGTSNGGRAGAFAAWLSDGAGRDEIDRFRVAGGVVAFTVWPAGRPRDAPMDRPY